jgi:hypothetical protein
MVKKKDAATPDLPLRPDAPAMPIDHTVDGRETNSGAWKFRLRMQPLERLKELLGLSHIEAGAIVADKKHRVAVVTHAEFDAWARLTLCAPTPASEKMCNGLS